LNIRGCYHISKATRPFACGWVWLGVVGQRSPCAAEAQT
jgi:hypothetical protein